MRIIFLIILTFVFCRNNLFGQNVIISGANPALKNTQLVFCTYSDQVTYLPDTLCKVSTDDNGVFSCSFDIKEIQPVFTSFGIYKYLLYAEPGKNYKVAFPEVKAKGPAEQINPYFEEITLFFRIENAEHTELNHSILRFDLTCNDYINARYNEIYKMSKNSGVDRMIVYIDSVFSSCQHPYFLKYKDYKFALIKYFAYVRNEQVMTREFYKQKPVLYNNTAYMNLFNQLFDNFFTYYAKTTEGEALTSHITKAKSARRIKELLRKNNVYDDETLQELIILKGLNDLLKAEDYNKNVIFQTLDSLSIQTKINFHKKIASNIKKQFLMKEPAMSLNSLPFLTMDSTKFDFENLKGKFVYLGVCVDKSYPCLEETELLKKWYPQKPKNIEFITVIIDENIKPVKDFFKKNKPGWTVLFCSNTSPVLKQLKAKAFPSYYFFDTDGKMILPFAKTMKEGFEVFFMRTFKP